MIGNAVNVGEAGAIVSQYGRADHFWLYIAPHGQLELYSVFTAGAAGIHVVLGVARAGTQRHGWRRSQKTVARSSRS